MTLLEALVVIAITALISAIGYPIMRAQGESARLRTEAHALVADLHRARAAAMHIDRTITLTPGRNGWRWDGGEERLDAPLHLVGDRAIVFYPDGSATTADLTLANDRASAAIRIEGATGRVTLVRP